MSNPTSTTTPSAAEGVEWAKDGVGRAPASPSGCCGSATGAPRASDADAVREMVKEGYTRVAERSSSCCGGSATSAATVSRKIGYSEEELGAIPDGANLGLGCGNPTAIDALAPGEVVVDLGSGAGMDAFLAASKVGPTGKVYGVDMTDAMLEKARENARRAGVSNVEFRKGQIEQLPLDDESADVIISNCVINLSPEKDRVFAEAYRVLRPGGRLMVSDVVLERPLPDMILAGVEAYIGCVAGASLRADYLGMIEAAGFSEVRVTSETSFGKTVTEDSPIVQEAMERFGVTADQVREFADTIRSLHVFARK